MKLYTVSFILSISIDRLVFQFLRASARGAERVNGSYRQNQKDEGGGGMVSKFMEHFVKFLITLIIIGLDQLY